VPVVPDAPDFSSRSPEDLGCIRVALCRSRFFANRAGIRTRPRPQSKNSDVALSDEQSEKMTALSLLHTPESRTAAVTARINAVNIRRP
jgi:hypothetical protein